MHKGTGAIGLHHALHFGATHSNLCGWGFDGGVSAFIQTTEWSTGVTKEAADNSCLKLPALYTGGVAVVFDNGAGLFSELEAGAINHSQVGVGAPNGLNQIVLVDRIPLLEGTDNTIRTFCSDITTHLIDGADGVT